ncbi:hypothetical protein GCM10027447_01960 [Glycomyces halotolerans]
MANTNKHDRAEAKRNQAKVRQNLPRSTAALGGITKREFKKKYPAAKGVGQMARLKDDYETER